MTPSISLSGCPKPDSPLLNVFRVKVEGCAPLSAHGGALSRDVALLTGAVLTRILLCRWFFSSVIAKTFNTRVWRWLLLSACALVFAFALQAKVGVYDHGRILTVSPSTSAKLWLNGERIQQHSTVPVLELLSFLVVMLAQLLLYRTPHAGLSAFAPTPRKLRLRDLHRTLRPPPAG